MTLLRREHGRNARPLNVRSRGAQTLWVVAKESDRSITPFAQKAADRECAMAVVDVEEVATIARPIGLTDCAAPFLALQHVGIDVLIHAVLAKLSQSSRALVVLAAQLFAEVGVGAIRLVPFLTAGGERFPQRLACLRAPDLWFATVRSWRESGTASATHT